MSEIPKLELKDVYISYTDRKGRTVQAAEDVNFTLANKPGVGEMAVVLGPSGCGKSTILKSVAGLLTPDSGTVKIDGQLVQGTGRDRGMVFQSYTSFAWRTVRQNVEYGLELQGIAKEERKKLSLAIIEKVGLKDFADALPRQLSGGMKQRVAIARTLVNKPRLILMDEPFGALDPQTRWGMQTTMLDVLKTEDNTVLFVTHDVAEAVYLADVIFVLSHRPAKVLHRIDVPTFESRNATVKQSAEFKRVENEVLELLHNSNVHGNIRVGL
ncbi:MAG: sulfonate ABC transporter ATP-binding protein [Archangium gephyra]|uniref:Sulfonate ABC transporter ATP-binding protein n=1 Tax=Archangium gephyra TaxID=48 RepID=A0A2W5T5Q5_9BACT|nr:MAG: sulfonate ABC transporter ATP-binding protein [Archangium gephyra]